MCALHRELAIYGAYPRKLLGQVLGEIVKLVACVGTCYVLLLLFCALHSSMNPYMVTVCRVECVHIYSQGIPTIQLKHQEVNLKLTNTDELFVQLNVINLTFHKIYQVHIIIFAYPIKINHQTVFKGEINS